MNFKINGMKWTIKELSQEKIKDIQNKRKNKEEEDIKNTETRYLGITYHDDLKIYLDQDLPVDRKKKTLMHELTHCYIGCYITHQEKQYDEEMVADIVSNSHDIIHEIVTKYFKKDKSCSETICDGQLDIYDLEGEKNEKNE